MKYSAAAIQTNFSAPSQRSEMIRSTRRMLELIDQTVEGYSPFLRVRLLVFPEFAHAAPIYPSLQQLRKKLGVEIPNQHTELLQGKAREHSIWIQSGSMLEVDPKYPGALFNTTCLIGPEGIAFRYRKVYPWLPLEVHTSPHDIEGYEEELFPVADTEIGMLGAAICYDWVFPEAIRELALAGAEVLIRVSAYMDPWGTAEPTAWWTIVNRCRALENLCYVVASNQAASWKNFPPFSWPGGSMIVDYDGRILAQATSGSGEKVVVGPVDLGSLRQERKVRVGHHMLAHLRSEAHARARAPRFPAGGFAGSDRTFDEMTNRVEEVKERFGFGRRPPGS